MKINYKQLAMEIAMKTMATIALGYFAVRVCYCWFLKVLRYFWLYFPVLLILGIFHLSRLLPLSWEHSTSLPLYLAAASP